jgi:hypothetical protein
MSMFAETLSWKHGETFRALKRLLLNSLVQIDITDRGCVFVLQIDSRRG